MILFCLEYHTIRKNSLMTDDRRAQPSKWVVLVIVIAIIFSAIVVVTICILLRVFRLDTKHEPANS